MDTTGVVNPDRSEKNFAGILLSEIKTNAKTSANVKIMVQAVLCWSEYYNGKWQPTKTSDINNPTNIDQFDLTGSNAFDRSKLYLFIAEEFNNLRIHIHGAGSKSPSFLMYNTHSLPIRSEDLVAFGSILFKKRKLKNDKSTFSSSYAIGMSDGYELGEDHLTRSILNTSLVNNFIQPQHYLPGELESPFFFSNSRHVFYVKTERKQVSLPNSTLYNHLISAKSRALTLDIPVLIFKQQFNILDRLKAEITDLQLNTENPDLIKRIVSEDTYINQAIDTVKTVQFGGKQIGIAGIVKN
jgi:hypothetical protein